MESMSDYSVSNGTATLYHYEKYSYDDLGRMSSKAEYQGTEVPADLTPYTLNYYYDSRDNITSITYGSAIPSEVDEVDYVYSGDRLSQIKVKAGNTGYTVKEYTYTAWGAVKTVKDYYDFKNSGNTKYIILDYTYNDLLNLSEMVYTKEDETVLERHSYVYDKAGKIIAEENSSSLNDLNEIRRYQYDTLGRLVLSDIKDIEEVTEEGETEVSEENKVTTAYSYDKVGNRLSKIENGVETVYEYNGLDQLTSENTDGDITEYTYDLNGNQTEVTSDVEGQTITRAFTYTPSGMMETYSEDNTLMQTNTYSGEGERIRKVEGANVTNYFYQEGSVLYTTGSGSTFNLLDICDTFGTVRNTDDYYLYLEDIHGSTTNLIDSAAGMVVSYWYKDFGEVTEERDPDYDDFVNEVQYTGAIYDDTTSLLYLNARFYDPATGRFISQDTYRGDHEEPDTWHLYAYCANDPVNFVDPSGHFLETAIDIASLYLSASDYIEDPSAENLAFLMVDILATIIPYVPGSYVLKVVEKGKGESEIIAKVCAFIPDKLDDLIKYGNKLVTGPYKTLRKIAKNLDIKIHRHHIVPKMLSEYFPNLKKNNYQAVILKDTVHTKITNKFNRLYKKMVSKSKTGILTKKEMRKLFNVLYEDMPELRKLANKQINKYYVYPRKGFS